MSGPAILLYIGMSGPAIVLDFEMSGPAILLCIKMSGPAITVRVNSGGIQSCIHDTFCLCDASIKSYSITQTQNSYLSY